MVGSHLAEYLLANTDWDIHGLIRHRSPLDNLQELIPLANRGERVFLKYGDLTDAASIRDVVHIADPHYVFHLAAQSFPQASFTAACATYDTNIKGTENLLDAILEFSSDSIVHVCSSSEVYGKVAASDMPIREDCRFHPASPYAISKVGADLIARHYAEAYGLKVMVTRMFTHTGPRRGDVFAESSFAKQIAMAEAGKGPQVIKVGNLGSMRTVADVRDAVRAYHMLVTVKPRCGAVYNIGGASTVTVGQILGSLICKSKLDFAIEEDPARMRPIDADNQIPDCALFKGVTGWEPRIKYDQTMSDLLDYWRKRVAGAEHLQR